MADAVWVFGAFLSLVAPIWLIFGVGFRATVLLSFIARKDVSCVKRYESSPCLREMPQKEDLAGLGFHLVNMSERARAHGPIL